jgi:hypothetical protein
MDRFNPATNVLIIFAAIIATLLRTTASDRDLPSDQLLKLRVVVRQLFGRNHLEPTSEESIAARADKFTAAQQALLRRYVAALEECARASTDARRAAGVKEAWWLPGGLEDDVHMLFRGDIITQRLLLPDEVTIGEPRMCNGRVAVTVRDFYHAFGGDPPETQMAEVRFEMVKGTWKISEIVYSRPSASREWRLSSFIADQTKKIRKLTAKALHMSSPPEIRKARPIGSPKEGSLRRGKVRDQIRVALD